MKKSNFKKNLAFIIPIAAILFFIVFKLCTMDISGATLKYDLKDNPDMVKVLTEAKTDSKALIVNGDNDTLNYTWTYDKGKVTDTKKTNLEIKPYTKYKKNIVKTLGTSNITVFTYNKDINLNGSPRLTFKDVNTKGNAYLFELKNGKVSYLKDAVSNDNDITFDVTKTDNIYILASGVNSKTLSSVKKKSVSLKAESKKEKEKIEKDTKDKKEESKKAAQKSSSKKVSKASSDKKKKASKKSKIKKSNGSPINLDKQKVDKKTTLSCTLTVECKDILDNKDKLKEGKEKNVPKNGYIYGPRNVTFYDGENVYDVLEREMRNSGIPFDADGYTEYSSAYVRGINNLYEFDCGKSSGWLYYVNGSRPSFGCSRYVLNDGDNIHWEFDVK